MQSQQKTAPVPPTSTQHNFTAHIKCNLGTNMHTQFWHFCQHIGKHQHIHEHPCFMHIHAHTTAALALFAFTFTFCQHFSLT